jgi:glycosyltransferase involved in cell wall biosynthesis
MKIIVILPFFHLGGVERWAINIISVLKKQGYEVLLIVVGSSSAKVSDFGTEPDSLGLTIQHGYRALWSSLTARGEPGVIITALSRLNFLLSIFGAFFGRPVITSVHLSISRQKHESRAKSQARKFVHRMIILLSHRVICVSGGILEELRSLSKRHIEKLLLIYNPCYNTSEIFERRDNIRPGAEVVRIVAAGRLHPQKGFDLLIRAFFEVPETVRDKTELYIFGEGEERERLESLISDLKLRNVYLKGATKVLMSELRQADIFVLSSRYEGFGNVLAEALASGCTLIAFDVKHGPREILADGKLGQLVEPEDIGGLATSITVATQQVVQRVECSLPSEMTLQRREQALRFTTEAFSHSISLFLPRLTD